MHSAWGLYNLATLGYTWLGLYFTRLKLKLKSGLGLQFTRALGTRTLGLACPRISYFTRLGLQIYSATLNLACIHLMNIVMIMQYRHECIHIVVYRF